MFAALGFEGPVPAATGRPLEAACLPCLRSFRACLRCSFLRLTENILPRTFLTSCCSMPWACNSCSSRAGNVGPLVVTFFRRLGGTMLGCSCYGQAPRKVLRKCRSTRHTRHNCNIPGNRRWSIGVKGSFRGSFDVLLFTVQLSVLLLYSLVSKWLLLIMLIIDK